MRVFVKGLIALGMLASAAPAFAQEILVTAQRRANYSDNDSGYNNGIVATSRPIIVLKRSADYVVQTVRVVGDTRDAVERVREVNATIQAAIRAAGPAGIELSTGDYVLQPLTEANAVNLPRSSDGRPDTTVSFFLAKVRLTPGMTIDGAGKKIADYVAAVPRTGRVTLGATGTPTLSVVNPDQYRGRIVDLIAADAAANAAKFGANYGVAVTGLDRPVEWARAGPTEVFLYLPAAYTVRRD